MSWVVVSGKSAQNLLLPVQTNCRRMTLIAVNDCDWIKNAEYGSFLQFTTKQADNNRRSYPLIDHSNSGCVIQVPIGADVSSVENTSSLQLRLAGNLNVV